MKKTLELSVEFSKLAVQKVLPCKHLFVAGSLGLGEVAAREGALKLKELTYIHCQAIKLSVLHLAQGGTVSYLT